MQPMPPDYTFVLETRTQVEACVRALLAHPCRFEVERMAHDCFHITVYGLIPYEVVKKVMKEIHEQHDEQKGPETGR